jgi:tRNA pseudouridine65 synthase
VIEILYRDEDVIVVDKPSGLLTHRSAMARDADVAMTRVRDAIGQRVWPAHRLDRATSGALLFALSEESARALGQAFEAGAVDKIYVAIARGIVAEHAIVDHPVPRGEGRERVAAVTEIARLHADPNGRVSLVEARPRTGRFHQIRRHLSHLRHPIAGDSNYGTGWFNRWMRAETGLARLALHARCIEFPTRAGRVIVKCPLAPDFAQALERLDVAPAIVAALEA